MGGWVGGADRATVQVQGSGPWVQLHALLGASPACRLMCSLLPAARLPACLPAHTWRPDKDGRFKNVWHHSKQDTARHTDTAHGPRPTSPPPSPLLTSRHRSLCTTCPTRANSPRRRTRVRYAPPGFSRSSTDTCGTHAPAGCHVSRAFSTGQCLVREGGSACVRTTHTHTYERKRAALVGV